jgi:tyrosyl-tRNA synthetase
VQEASQALFGRGDVRTLDPRTLADATSELPGAVVAVGAELVDALVATGLVDSRKAARRVITEGGAYLNNERVEKEDAVLGEGDFLHGEVALLRRGRRSLAGARRAG